MGVPDEEAGSSAGHHDDAADQEEGGAPVQLGDHQGCEGRNCQGPGTNAGDGDAGCQPATAVEPLLDGANGGDVARPTPPPMLTAKAACTCHNACATLAMISPDPTSARPPATSSLGPRRFGDGAAERANAEENEDSGREGDGYCRHERRRIRPAGGRRRSRRSRHCRTPSSG